VTDKDHDMRGSEKFLVTGGAGFIGSHLSERLLRDGHRVTVLDNLSTGRLANVKHLQASDRFDFVLGDVRDEALVSQLVAKSDRVAHLAAAVGVRLVMENPVETILVNVRGTENVLKAAAESIKPVLLASTSEVYGKAMDHEGADYRLAEDGDWRLGATSRRRWAYACSKAMDEFLALAYFVEKQLPVVVVRFFNTVGPRQSGQYGMVIPAYVQRALRHENIQVHGTGDQTRCFNHVDDAVDAVVRLFASPRAIGEVFNVGNDKEISMMQLAHRVRELAGSQSEIVTVSYESVYPTGFEDMKRRTPSLVKLRSVIEFEPMHTIETILASVIAHSRQQEVNL
jgi:UDP-glucose 4-epimerase